MPEPTPPRIFVDADACPVKAEVYRVADRYQLDVIVVANQRLGVPLSPRVKLVVVSGALDAADDWIAEQAGPRDIVVTTDVPLAARAVAAGAFAITPKGTVHDERSVGDALATRNLLTALREANPTEPIGGGPKPFAPKDRSRFLQALDALVHRARRGG